MSVQVKLYSKKDFERVASVKEKREEAYRTSFRRDYARLIHCPSFRRLQGKTQVFPGHESDFFRNRLTHSLEVAQIGKSIAIRLNGTSSRFKGKNQKIDTDLVEFAGLAHDLGHPPFGHNGETALDECMKDYGGFEGNAQTLRILSRLEKKQTLHLVDHAIEPIDPDGNDIRCGLNLSYRALASVLKYDKLIPLRESERIPGKIAKGYYSDDRELVNRIKTHVIGTSEIEGKFKTIECSIMDVADDIAYSTYDLEDCLKAFFLTPMFMFVATNREEIFKNVACKTKSNIDEAFPELSKEDREFGVAEVVMVLFDIFRNIFAVKGEELELVNNERVPLEAKKWFLSVAASAESKKIAENGYERTKLTSRLVQEFISGIEVRPHRKFPQLHQVRLRLPTFVKVEVLKHMTFEGIIRGSNMRVVEFRGKDIIMELFSALNSEDGYSLMPEDYRNLFRKFSGIERRRVICDFLAGMTDRYALEFYSRLYGGNPQTIHKPL